MLIDLDFDGQEQAQAFLESLRRVWSSKDLSPGLSRTPAAGAGAGSPKVRLVEEVETRTYG